MKKTTTLLLSVAALLLLFSSCDKSDFNAAGDVAKITDFSLQGISATFDINDVNGDITHSGLLPQGTDLTNLVADFQASPGATVLVNSVVQVNGTTPNNFTKKVTYYVLSRNRSYAKEYDVFVKVVGAPGSDESELTAFSIPSLGVDFTVDQNTGVVTNPDTLLMGTDVSALVAEFTFSNGASVQVGGATQMSGVTVNDFTNPVTYSVTSADLSSTSDYVVTVKVN